MTLRMGDATAPSLLPASGLDVAAGYVDGYRTDYQQIVAAFPTLKHLAFDAGHVDLEMSTPFDCLDVESGAFAPADFPDFLAKWHPLNTPLPAGYISTSNAHNLITASAGRTRSSWLLLTAHYTDVPHICTSAQCWPQSPFAWQADGTQWTDHGGVWDESLLADHFFADPPPEDPVTPQDKQDIIAGVLSGLRQLFAPPAGELYGRAVQADNASEAQTQAGLVSTIVAAVKAELPAGTPSADAIAAAVVAALASKLA